MAREGKEVETSTDSLACGRQEVYGKVDLEMDLHSLSTCRPPVDLSVKMGDLDPEKEMMKEVEAIPRLDVDATPLKVR